MKYAQLKKRLIIESSIVGAILLVVGGITYFLSDSLDEYEKEAHALELSVAKATAERTALSGKFDKTKQNADLYEEALKKNPKSGIYNGRQDIQDQFNKLQEHDINDMTLNVSLAKEPKDAKLKRPFGMIVSSDLKINFNTLLDDNALTMLDAMQSELLGVPKITSFKITRSEDISEKVLQSVRSTGSYPLVKAEVTASWLSIKPQEAAQAKDEKPKP